jgi:transposase
MRGKIPAQPSLLALVSVDSLVPSDHPLRRIKPLAEEALRELSPTFDKMYAEHGRPSVPPERVLKTLLMALFSVRSERAFCEQLRYNMLFRWFLDMDMTDQPFVPTVFTHNRARLMSHDVATAFLGEIVRMARSRRLLSEEHFSVDGTLIEAWASMKSFRRKDDDDHDNNGFGTFQGEKRSNDTHESKTDPQARLIRKGRGKEAKLAYMGHALIENRNGLVVDFDVTPATGTAEREAAVRMIERQRRQRGAGKPRRITVAADKAYDSKAFVQACRAARATPHVAQFVTSRRRSNVDGRTTRHPGYAMSTRARRLIEKVFGWMKGFGGIRRTRFRGLDRTSLTTKFVAAAYNILRIANLTTA